LESARGSRACVGIVDFSRGSGRDVFICGEGLVVAGNPKTTYGGGIARATPNPVGSEGGKSTE
jgi:hypothetical protein